MKYAIITMATLALLAQSSEVLLDRRQARALSRALLQWADTRTAREE